MKYQLKFLLLLVLVNISLSYIDESKYKNLKINRDILNPHIIAIMVEFQHESINDPLTSGDGSFLQELDIDMIWNDSDDIRCSGFIVDKPPHDSDYFTSQIQALSNYYYKSSNEHININGNVILNQNHEKGYYKLSKTMREYSYSDNDLSKLFKEALEVSKTDIEKYLADNPTLVFEDIIFTVFHAGIGQDFSFPTFDPTIYDIKSAFIEPSMFSQNLGFPEINGNEVSSGILIPETQNMIFYDSIEDIFYANDNYCGYQLGMTGTFAFLTGYALGLPPLFDTQTGKPGVGVFSLMDYGSNNGRGVIPALPSPWTRILKSWQSPIDMTDSLNFNSLVFDMEVNNIYKFDISNNEYFLLENYNNKIDSLSIESIISTDSTGYWFDTLIDKNIFEFSEDSVITGVANYNLGLPNSGILIWHINEPQSELYDGINNDRFNKSISIEEADGALDIGFESYALFSANNPTNGTKWDFWNKNNEAYFYTNNNQEICIDDNYMILSFTSKFSCESNNGIWYQPVIFDNFSNPNSNTNDKIDSFLSFEILDSISKYVMRVKANYQSPLDYDDFNFLKEFSIVGTSMESVFYKDSLYVYEFNLENYDLNIREDLSTEGIVLTDGAGVSNSYDTYGCISAYLNQENNFICSDMKHYFGYFHNDVDNLTLLNISDFTNSENISLGDIDSDGFDEIIWTQDGSIYAKNFNNTPVNGFPVSDNYHGVVLILKNDIDGIVLVSRNYDYIEILSLEGETLYSLPSISNQDILSINGKLSDGIRFYDYNTNDGSYWMQKYSRHTHFPAASGFHVIPEYYNKSSIDKFYNYPNPIIDNQTTFRFKVYEEGDIKINIYNLSGHKVESLLMNNDLILNDYNEISHSFNSLPSGLYYAEILHNNKKQKIIKIVIGY